MVSQYKSFSMAGWDKAKSLLKVFLRSGPEGIVLYCSLEGLQKNCSVQIVIHTVKTIFASHRPHYLYKMFIFNFRASLHIFILAKRGEKTRFRQSRKFIFCENSFVPLLITTWRYGKWLVGELAKFKRDIFKQAFCTLFAIPRHRSFT